MKAKNPVDEAKSLVLEALYDANPEYLFAGSIEFKTRLSYQLVSRSLELLLGEGKAVRALLADYTPAYKISFKGARAFERAKWREQHPGSGLAKFKPRTKSVRKAGKPGASREAIDLLAASVALLFPREEERERFLFELGRLFYGVNGWPADVYRATGIGGRKEGPTETVEVDRKCSKVRKEEWPLKGGK